MKLVRGAWKLLVGIKDALVLLFMLFFFGALFAVLSAKPNPAAVKDGALVLDMAGTIVEQPARVDPLAAIGGGDAPKEMRLRDIVRALDAAKDDDRVKAVVLDLDMFMGGYPAAITQVGEAIRRVRDAKKPVLAYATGYSDSAYLLAANASEVWVHPMGGILFSGPGGSRLYYKGLIDKLGVTAHVYKVGKFKSAVEPYIRSDQSPEAREANQALYGAIFDQWKQAVKTARPKARIDPMLMTPDAVVTAAKGDFTKANLELGMVDKVGDRLAFGKRVAELAGVDDGKPAGSYRAIKYANWLQAHPLPTGGDAIGVITVAGEIVDGKGAGDQAGGDAIAEQLLKGLAKKKLKALVVRVDSPGGSALASERIRQAILQAKAQGLPVVTSMGSLAASGGYWVSTPGDIIFAEPNTITGSIGIFGLLPTFEKTLAKIGVSADGVQTTPLTGQPDIYSGTNQVFDTVLQAGIEDGYRRFTGLVAQSRKMTPQRVDEIGQGRVWIGGTARQLGLVDRFGNLDDAIAEAAKRAKLDPKNVHAVYLEKEPGFFETLIANWASSGDDEEEAMPESRGDLYARIAAERRAVFAQALGDARRLAAGTSMQARCLECAAFGPIAAPSKADVRLMDLVLAKLAW
ncbi:signal peptide peptidase SppA [Sphingomonas sp.]|uniref:signal peptide peptidase SppA n=1 Tax=Sphingomonas sp. TaxID=28214 RepID=UPI001ED3ADAE|nr:signal peptide peptidase SppA [Sphingomonas sp.]MBX3595626.1 signal peptide peptidase SppA [Sphingomonas sp.]